MKLLDTNSDDVKIKGWDVYSTEETPIGTWIDGKTIYRRVATATLGSTSSWTTLVNISSWNVSVVTQLYGYCSSGEYSKRIPMYESGSYYITVARKGNYIYYLSQGHSGVKVVLIIEYTKTS